MWMQALVAAGLPTIGSAFPMNWQDKLKQHNPRGFFESMFREGVNYETNPHPQTGLYLFPDQVKGHVVKVFPGGLVRSDYSFIDRVVATMRDWRSYDQSVRALLADDRPDKEPSPLPPWLHWWLENYAMIRDVVIRKHPTVMTSYDAVLRDPEQAVGSVIDWLEQGDRDAAIAAIDPELSRSRPDPKDSPPDEVAEVFDALYAAVDTDRTVPAALVKRLNETHQRIVTENRDLLEST